MKIGTKIKLPSGTKGTVIQGDNLNDAVPENLIYVQLEKGKKFYYEESYLAEDKPAPKKVKVVEPVDIELPLPIEVADIPEEKPVKAAPTKKKAKKKKK